mgnify:CR=1 FL=1
MADLKTIRINKVLRELNISLDRAVEHLSEKGFSVEARPTAKISHQEYELLLDAFQTDRSKKEASHEVFEEKRKEKEVKSHSPEQAIPNHKRLSKSYFQVHTITIGDFLKKSKRLRRHR